MGLRYFVHVFSVVRSHRTSNKHRPMEGFQNIGWVQCSSVETNLPQPQAYRGIWEHWIIFRVVGTLADMADMVVSETFSLEQCEEICVHQCLNNVDNLHVSQTAPT